MDHGQELADALTFVVTAEVLAAAILALSQEVAAILDQSRDLIVRAKATYPMLPRGLFALI